MSISTSLISVRKSPAGSFGEWVLRGVGQVFLQNNPLSGVLFLIAIFISNWFAGMDALVGTIAATAVALLLGVSKEEVSQGLYGFNGTLVAVALTFFLPDDWKLIGYVVLAAAASTVLTAALHNLLHTNQVPGLTAAFIATIWLFIAGVRQFGHLTLPAAALEPHLPTTVTGGSGAVHPVDLLTGFFNAFAEVFLQSGVLSGVLILIGLLINSRISAVAAAVGSLVGFCTAWMFGLPAEFLGSGLAGYNPVLVVIAIGGVFYVVTIRSAILAVVAGIVSVIIFAALMTLLAPLGLPVATAPFVLTTWACLFAANSLTALRRPEVTTD